MFAERTRPETHLHIETETRTGQACLVIYNVSMGPSPFQIEHMVRTPKAKQTG